MNNYYFIHLGKGMHKDTKNELERAINNKLEIELVYDNGKRKAKPYHVGTLGGQDQLHAYQISGESKSGQHTNWKNFKLSKISNLNVTGVTFEPGDGYNPSNSKYTNIEHQVSFDGTGSKNKPK